MKIFLLGTFLLTFGLHQYWCTAHYQVSAEETDKTIKNKRSILHVSPYLTHYLFRRPSHSKQDQSSKPVVHAVIGFTYGPGNESTHIKSPNRQAHVEILSKYPKKKEKRDQPYGDQSIVPNNNDIDSRLEKNSSGSQWSLPAAHDWLSSNHHRNGHRRKKMSNIDAEFNSVAIGSVQDLMNDDSNLISHSARGTKEIALLNCSNYQHTKIKIYNLRIAISIVDKTECLRCPGSKIIVAKQGEECAPLLLPIIKSCPGSRNRTRPLRLFMAGDRTVGRTLPEGSHIIHLRFQSDSSVTTCAFRYHVKVNRCPIPKCIDNGYSRCTEGRAWGSRCHFTCNPGYTISGNSISYCEGTSSGVNWTQFPVCEKVGTWCDKPNEIKHGTPFCNKPEVSNGYPSGTICTYHCDDCYEIEDSRYSTIECYDSNWNNTVPPICIPKSTRSCKTPTVPYNAYLECSVCDTCDKIVGTVCQYLCNPGYRIPSAQLGREYIKCTASKVWNSTDLPECYERRLLYCEDQKVSTNVPLKLPEFETSVGVQTECRFLRQTVPGFYEYTCEATDPTRRIIKECNFTVEEMCDRPQEIENGEFSCSETEVSIGYPSGTICTYHCDDRYEMVDSRYSTIECYYRNWNNMVPPICKPKPTSSCITPVVPHNGYFECSVCDTCDKIVGTVCQYLCNSGYRIPSAQLGRKYIKCTASKVWNSTDPPECYESRLLYCEDQKVSTNKPLKLPEFGASVGVQTECRFLRQSVPGFYEYMCEATYPIRRIIEECQFTVEEMCDRPQEIENGEFSCNGTEVSNGYPSGTICTYHCHDRYEMVDSRYSTIECYYRNWNNPVPPICKPKPTRSCKPPVVPYNAYLECSVCDTCDKIVGTVCQYLCIPGYRIPSAQLGREYIKCTASKVWNSTDLPECYERVPVYCENQKVSINEPIKIPEFSPSVGVQTDCSFLRQSVPGVYENKCEATDPIRRTIEECHFTVEVFVSPPRCDDITITLKQPFVYRPSNPIITTSTGHKAIDVTCTKTNAIILDYGEVINHCTAVDPISGIGLTCSYTITILESNCISLTTPANAEMMCRMVTDTNIFRCDIKCNSGFSVLSAYEKLMNKGYVDCDVRTGEWDFTHTYGIKFIPDCLGEAETGMTTGIIFKVTVDDCRNESNILKIKENIRKGLLNKNNILCSQVDCTDFTYLCNLDQHGVSILEISWNITAHFTPVSEDDYSFGSEEAPEAEVYLTEIQQNTYSIVTNDENFQLQLLEDGATIREESYKQGLIDLICSKKSYVIEEETNRCLQCPTGSYYSDNACLLCPLNSFQDETGQDYCKTCSDGSITWVSGAKNQTDCFDQNQLQQLFHGDNRLNNPKCYRNSCRNGGTCYVVGHEDFCFCPAGFTGNFCEIQTCESDYCSNGGKCRYEEGQYICSCPVGTAGSKCEMFNDQAMTVQSVNHCLSAPCMKGGICVQPQMNDFYYCQCSKDRTGDHCEHAVCPEPYEQLFCLHGGRCVILDDTHAMVCLCKAGFIGSRCEFIEDRADKLTEEMSSHH